MKLDKRFVPMYDTTIEVYMLPDGQYRLSIDAVSKFLEITNEECYRLLNMMEIVSKPLKIDEYNTINSVTHEQLMLIVICSMIHGNIRATAINNDLLSESLKLRISL